MKSVKIFIWKFSKLPLKKGYRISSNKRSRRLLNFETVKLCLLEGDAN